MSPAGRGSEGCSCCQGGPVCRCPAEAVSRNQGALPARWAAGNSEAEGTRAGAQLQVPILGGGGEDESGQRQDMPQAERLAAALRKAGEQHCWALLPYRAKFCCSVGVSLQVVYLVPAALTLLVSINPSITGMILACRRESLLKCSPQK